MATATDQKVGKVIQVIGPVIDVEYEGGYLPAIYNAVRIVAAGEGGQKIDIVAEVEQHLGEGRVRTVAMKTTDGLQRGDAKISAHLLVLRESRREIEGFSERDRGVR